ncbi:MAG: type II toxin-antitoxin system VapC family toxin [Deltaproteobacteria bacterium]|nr:type II toxin-antitoxin system VapC family toxin [Deltaproteobacteria bacterium]MBW1817513.1 type II toxin-antitoxin system VapC family toxin [Deltaproteobacteria bacterium]
MASRVVDTSVLAALAFGEPRSSEAEMLLKGHDLIAPTLLGYELASVAVKKIELHPEQAEAILKALSMVLEMDIQWIEVDYAETAILALETRMTAYDASYLYLSRMLGIPLLSFDQKLNAQAGN